MNKFYTTSCVGKDIADLKPMLETLEALLIDIRFSPATKEIEWRRDYLQVLLKRRYRHVQNLGNRADNQHKAEIQNLELGIRTILSFENNLVLLCDCPELEKCHRLTIMNAMRKKELDVEEIDDWKMLNHPINIKLNN